MRVPTCTLMQDMSSAHLDITEFDGAFVSSQLCEGMRGKPAAHPNLHDRPAPCVQWQLLTLSVNRDYWYEYSICHTLTLTLLSLMAPSPAANCVRACATSPLLT